MAVSAQAAPLAPLEPSSRTRDPGSSALRATIRRIFRRRTGVLGVAILGMFLFITLTADFISPSDPLTLRRGEDLQAPSAAHLFGTDEHGRDILSRIIHGTRSAFLVAFVAVSCGATAGVVGGILAGYLGGRVDSVIMRLNDVVLAFPGLLVGIAVVTVLGPGTINVAWALAIGLMPNVARVTRSSVLSERERDYVLAARAIGARDGRIMFRHILPNTLPPTIVQISLALGFTVLADASLSFLGLGTQPPAPSWGNMLNASQAFMREAPWYGIAPGVCLAILVFGLNHLSDSLRDALDPRRAREA